mgnify:CR=1 FL=1
MKYASIQNSGAITHAFFSCELDADEALRAIDWAVSCLDPSMEVINAEATNRYLGGDLIEKGMWMIRFDLEPKLAEAAVPVQTGTP